MKVGDLLLDESEIVENFVRAVGPASTIPPTIRIADLAISVAGDEPLSRV
jgi:hypothetical protein